MADVYNFNNEINEEALINCSNLIKEGKTVVFPTETVYGIGADATNVDAVKKIFEAKGRESDNPLIVHISKLGMLDTIVETVGETEKKLIDTFWPGPLTIIFNKKENIPANVTAGLNTVAVRMPDNEVALRFIELADCPIAAPSANISGKPSGTRIEDIIGELDDRVDAIIDYGNSRIGVESTVIKVVDNDLIKILRPGKITADDFLFMGYKVQLDEHIIKAYDANNPDDKVESPGMKYRHYAPKTSCVLVEGKNYDEVISKINKRINDEPYKNIFILGYDEDREHINTNNFIAMGSKYNLSQVAQNIFVKLREVDKYNADYIMIEMIPKKEIGLAIYNRVIRACEYETM